MGKYYCILILLCLSLEIFGQIKPVNLSNDWEVWYGKVPVSGEIRVGILSSFDSTNIVDKSFYVHIPQEHGEFLCVQINSIDGRYKGELQYNIKELDSGVFEFYWPSSHLGDLKKFSHQELSILCTTDNNCDSDTNDYLVSSWKNTPVDTVYVLLNSDKKTYISIFDKEKETETKISCDKMDKLSMVTFNCVCKIPEKDITNNSQITIKQRIRRPGRVTFNKYPMKIVK